MGLHLPTRVGTVVKVSRVLNWMWSRGFRFLFVLDALVLLGIMLVVNILRFGFSWPTYPVRYYLLGFALATATHLVVNYFSGLYERESRLGTRPILPRVAMSLALGVAFGGLFTVFMRRYLMPRWNILAVFVLGSLSLAATRHLSRHLADRRRGPSRVILGGASEELELARSYFGRAQEKVQIVAEVPDLAELPRVAAETRADDVLLFDLDAYSRIFPEPLGSLDDAGVGVHQRVSAREALLGLKSVRQIAGMPFARVSTNTLASHQMRLKRLLDLGVIIVGAPVWIPVLGLLAAWVRVVAGPGIFYVQDRVGRHGEVFRIVKFRTMHHLAEHDGPRLSSSDDDRVVPALRWMRAMRFDELPQILNILRNQMSLVGPRPERPDFSAGFERTVEGYDRRHQIAPGLTGAAQVNGYYDTHASHKLGYDLHYLVNWSILLDLQILVRTLWVVLARRV